MIRVQKYAVECVYELSQSGALRVSVVREIGAGIKGENVTPHAAVKHHVFQGPTFHRGR